MNRNVVCLMDLFKITSKIASLARSGFIICARELFDKMPIKDTVAWNAMITGFARLGLVQDALLLFSKMRISGARPDHFTLTAALSASADSSDLNSGRQFHAIVVSSGYGLSLPVCNSLIDMYGKCSCPLSAQSMFNHMDERNEVSWCSLLFAYSRLGDFGNAHLVFSKLPFQKTIAWNILIWGYSHFGEIEMSLDLLKKMQLFGFRGDLWTFSSLMNACSELGEPCFGCMLHACIVKSGWDLIIVVNNSILSFYAKLGWMDDAFKIFNSTGMETMVSWNTMIDAYMKAGEVEKALSLFSTSPKKNLVSWTAMIGGYARNGSGEEALAMFLSMMRSHFQPDEFTFGSVLHACSSLAVLSHGRMVHSSLFQSGFASFVYIGNGLVNMYTKCGDIKSSTKVFDEIIKKDIVSWNTMLFGFALHGWALNAFDMYQEMMALGVFPDKVTFLGLLMACSHSGLVEQGRQVFEMMNSLHGVQPDADHMTCMVDMLGRAGCLKESKQLLEDSLRYTTNSCEALLGACTVHGDMGIGRKVGEELVSVEPQKEVGYVMLSNLYCANGQWDEAVKVRKLMAEHGVKKVPGCSWIEVRNMVMVFVTGTNSLPHMKDVCTMLGLLDFEMRKPCF